MNNELQTMVSRLKEELTGNPWYGRSVYEILDEVDQDKAFIRPGADAHSMIELLYHMITWAGFAMKCLEQPEVNHAEATDLLDWREIDPQTHGWKEGLDQYRQIHDKLLDLLLQAGPEVLDKQVIGKNYTTRTMLNGLIDHNTYHQGQIAYVHKLLG